jgi:predicted RNA-binding protein with PIN domain
MPLKPDDVYAEVARWPLADRLRLAARILEAAAREAENPRATASSDATAKVPPRSVAPAGGAAPPGVSAPAPPRPTDAPAVAAAPRQLLIVDGSNFLGTTAGFTLATDSSREELITRLQDYVHDHPSVRVIVYFDGQKTSVRRIGGVEVRFTPRERPADFFILEGLKKLGEEERRHALLVTADRALGDAARRLGAKVEAPTSFNRRLPGAKRTAVGERGLSAAEVADWEEYFNRRTDRDPKG